jgi:lysophospholipase L1-like esterase
MRMPDRRSLVLLLGTTAIFAAALELSFRLLEPRLGIDRQRIQALRDHVASGGVVALHEPRPHVLYARPPGIPGVNSLGFNDDEFRLAKTPGTLRIACLGSSTTEGGNPEGHEGSYPRQLKHVLEERTGRAVEVMNFGMAGWTTAETMVNYFLVVQDYAPDIVVIHEAPNDVDPRRWPGFRTDYSHFRKPWSEVHYSLPYRLLVRWSDIFAASQLRDPAAFDLQAVVTRTPEGPLRDAAGALPPETAVAFRRNVQTIAEHVRLRGGHPILATVPYDAQAQGAAIYRGGIDDHNRILRELSQKDGFTLADVDQRGRTRAGGLHPFFLDLVHMTKAGNRFKAEAIADAILEAGLAGPDQRTR